MTRHRRSPVRHSVRSHVRDGHKIPQYMRGKGTHGRLSDIERSAGRFKRLSDLTGGEPKPFTVNFKYSNRKGDGESVMVISKSYEKALDEAFEEKVDKRDPISVEVIDPDFGRMFKAMGTAAKKAGKLGAKGALIGAKYSVRGAELFGKAAAEAVAKRVDSYEERLRARKLIRESYAPDRSKRLMARAKLREEFPEIYTVSDFSRKGEKLYEVPRRPETPTIRQHKKTLAQLRKQMKRKHIKPVKVAPLKRGESAEEYENRLERAIERSETAIEKAEKAKQRKLEVEIR